MNKQTLVTSCPIRMSVRKGSRQFASLQHSGKKKQNFVTVILGNLSLGARSLVWVGYRGRELAKPVRRMGLCQLLIMALQPLPPVPYPNKLAWQAKGTLWVYINVKKSDFIVVFL